MEVKMRIKKLNGLVKEERERERVAAENEKNKYLIEYVAMMSDVDLPTESENTEGGERNE